MQNVKRIVCLANSRKSNGRCIAGREWSDNQAGQWIRPVSARENQEVRKNERQYENRSDPQVLDIIDIPLLKRQPEDYQTENWLLDSEHDWRKVGHLPRSDLPALTDPDGPLWLDGHSTSKGKNNKIPLATTGSIADSLRLIRIECLQLNVAMHKGFGHRRPRLRVQGRFSHAGNEYALWVTDPKFEQTYFAKPAGDYEIGECYLTISLGEYQGACYKLIAAIITAGGQQGNERN